MAAPSDDNVVDLAPSLTGIPMTGKAVVTFTIAAGEQRFVVKDLVAIWCCEPGGFIFEIFI